MLRGKLLCNTTRLRARIRKVLGNAYVRNEELYVNADKSEQLLGVVALTQKLFIKFRGISSRIRCGTSVVLVDSHHAR